MENKGQTPHLLIFAKHEGCSKEFLFAVPYYLEVRKGDILEVDTKKGRAIAIATTEMFEGMNIDEVATKFGASLPLREVKQVAGKLLQNYMIRKVKSDIMQKINNINKISTDDTLPF